MSNKIALAAAALAFVLTVISPIPAAAQPADLNLETAIQKALDKNYGIVISMAEAEIAGVNNSWGKAGRFPSLTSDMTLSQAWSVSQESSSSTQRITPGIGLRWLLFDGFRVNITKERLGRLEELSNGQSMVVIENTIEDVMLAYYNVLLQQEKLDVYNKVLQLASDRYDYELNRRELGGSVTYNVLLAQNEYLTEKALVLSQEVSVRNSIRTLNFLMGDASELQWTFTTEFTVSAEDYEVADLLSRMKENNQVLRNQYIALSLKESDEKLARSDMLPSLTFNSGLDYSGSTTAGKLNGSVSPSASMTLAYDIFNGGVRKDAIRIARISKEIAEVEQEEMEHALTNQLFGAYDNHQVRKALVGVADENLAAASLNLEIAGEKYRSGLINQFNYRDIQLIYQNVAIRKLEAVYDLIESRAALTRLTGGFLSLQ